MTQSALPLSPYPGMEHMPAIVGNTLYTIRSDGGLQVSGNVNHRFQNELDCFNSAFAKQPERFLLAAILPRDSKSNQAQWKNSASLYFTEQTFQRLQSLEAMLSRMLPKQVLRTHILAPEMSTYAGMRRLNMYGLLLGYHPIIVIDSDGNPMAINLRGTAQEDTETSFQRHLKALSLTSLFCTSLQERNFVDGVFQLCDTVEIH